DTPLAVMFPAIRLVFTALLISIVFMVIPALPLCAQPFEDSNPGESDDQSSKSDTKYKKILTTNYRVATITHALALRRLEPDAILAGCPILSIAVHHNDLTGIQALVDAGANINAIDERGRTALHTATQENRVAIIHYLLAQPSINLNVEDHTGLTALDVAEGPLAASIIAQRLGYPDNYFETQAGFNVLDEDHRTALQTAILGRHTAIVTYLLRRPNINLNHADREGRTALHMAAHMGYARMVDQLMTAHADPGLRDNRGLTALDIAGHGRAASIVTLLIQHAVDGYYDGGALHWLIEHPRMRTAVQAGLERRASRLQQASTQRNANKHTPLYSILVELSKSPVGRYYKELLKLISHAHLLGLNWDDVQPGGDTPRQLALRLAARPASEPSATAGAVEGAALEHRQRNSLRTCLKNAGILERADPEVRVYVRLTRLRNAQLSKFIKQLVKIRRMRLPLDQWDVPEPNGDTPRGFALRLLEAGDGGVFLDENYQHHLRVFLGHQGLLPDRGAQPAEITRQTTLPATQTAPTRPLPEEALRYEAPIDAAIRLMLGAGAVSFL
ncbi:MAG TPA: ankyrin repeat domain-containing protein, partial [Opitutales bacterium]|nr:ankyrin repeat domain-containing protein [Opitutales bacterium]